MVGPNRDRLTWWVYGCLAVYGYFLYGFGPTVPLVGDDQDLSRAMAALHGTALAVGAVTAGLASPRLAARWGRVLTLRCGVLGLAGGLTVYLLGDTLPVTLLGALLAGTFGSITVNMHSVLLSQHHGTHAPAVLNEANALASGLGLVAPAVIGLAVGVGLGWRAGLAVAVLAALVVVLAGLRVDGDRPAPTTASRPRPPSPPLPSAFWPALGVLLVCVGTEFCLTFWSSDLLRQRTGATTAVATACVAALVLGMTMGRIGGSRLAARHPPDGLLAAALTLSVVGFGVLWLSTTLWLAVLGLFVVGVGLSVQFPLAIYRVIAASGGQADRATGLASIGAGVAIGTAPFLLGFLADVLDTHRAFLLVPVLLLLAAVLLRSGRATAGAATGPA